MSPVVDEWYLLLPQRIQSTRATFLSPNRVTGKPKLCCVRLSSVVTPLIGRGVLVLLLICASVVSAHAQQAGATNITASSIVGAAAIVVDGELSDAGWQPAVPVTTFVQRDPLEGAEPSFKTEARIVYDSSAIYVGVRAFDADPSRIIGFLTRRDAGSASDWIQVYIDSYYDRRTAYQFSVNPLGVKQDAYWYNENESDDSWDAVWDVVVRRTTDGWQAEFRIPFSQLRFSGKGDGQLGFAISRQVARLNETSTWPLISKSASGWVSSFGTLNGVNIGSASKRLEFVPYTVAQVLTEPRQPGNPLPEDAGSRRIDRRRPQICGDAVVDADGDSESRLRTGRSRSRGGQSERVRDLLSGEASVLHRGLGDLSIRVPRLQSVLLASHWPAAARLSGYPRRWVCVGAEELDDPRCRQVDGASPQFLGGCAYGGDR